MSTSENFTPDPAAIFAIAHSLWQALQKPALTQSCPNLSETYNGMDELMRVVMAVGTQFEVWACTHIAFEKLGDVWPYLMEDRFGDTCLTTISPSSLAKFNNNDCLRMALRMNLPIKFPAN